MGNTCAGWGSIPVVFPWHGRPPVSHPTCDISFPPRRTGEYWKAMIPVRPLYRGVRRSVGDPETSRERVDDWGGPETVWALLCVAERRATRPNGEWGSSTRRHMLGPERPEAVLPQRGVVLTDLQSTTLLIVNKLLSSLSVSLSRSLARSTCCACFCGPFSAYYPLQAWLRLHPPRPS